MTGAVEPLLQVVPATVTGPLVPLWIRGWAIVLVVCGLAVAIFLQIFARLIPPRLSRRIEVGVALLFYPTVLFLCAYQTVEVAQGGPWWRVLLNAGLLVSMGYWALWALKHRRLLPPMEPER